MKMKNCMKWGLFLFIVCIYSFGYSQGSDLLLLKKSKKKTMQTFFAGSFIRFTDINGREESGVIKKIERDTLFIIHHDIRRGYNIWGTSVADTVSAFLNRYHYNEIQALYKPPKSFEFIRNGALFMIAGTGYAVLHLANSAIQSEKVDGKTMAIAGGVAALGFIMYKMRKYKYQIGKKYRLTYISMTKDLP
jgi:hypothetical protein